ncbi:DNA polymerase III, delta subunit [Novosphingobium aromaticivorans DSM 12444]|uniref:DNA-directed DNA polymerase n=1 Tax=Novosphingobium aromaticivorans (strain ATCC 700278 / DSM 12444 / CCUG 56034 / CIP 105152 / NBRC 16084 / F199) TaxID=279238 RepID=Q2G3C1_NOVAD|nr:DNA polymerase III subunit delta [Novosphingobium aromaticivorans]ABD27652.1 DNA polymerase III, delta subunit [Novosphingobium aromaticivorans DSM 12444]SCY31399.1 DNA polymerase III, delta subunit [Novosphingobium aromaticivorans]
MKLTQKTFPGSAARAAKECRIFYFCGPDEAGASDAANRIAAMLGEAEKVELTGAELRRDPVKLADEARSVSLFGDRRIIHVRATGDDAFEAVDTLVASPVEGWPVLIVATSATDKSRIAKLLENRTDAMVGMFHPPDMKSVAGAVRDMADAAGVNLTGDLAERIARSTALDTRMARSEIEKIALYLDASPQARRTADAEVLDEICAVSEDDSLMPVVNAVLGGDVRKLSSELARMREVGLNPVGLLLAFERRATQLAQLAGRMGDRSDINAFMEQETAARRVFFRDRPDLTQQLRRWRGPRLARLLERLAQLHRTLMADNRNGELVLAQGLAEIARAAAR